MKMTTRMMTAGCGLALAVTAASQAQPFQINITGATLQQNFLTGPASTHDYIDVNNDGVAIKNGPGLGNVQQLAPTWTGSLAGQWVFNYRATGSVNGIKELINFGSASPSLPAPKFVFGDATGPLTAAAANPAFINRTQYLPTGPSNALNPGGSPTRSQTFLSVSGYQATVPGNALTEGLQIDIAASDVPHTWGLANTNTDGGFNSTPGMPGYGNNPRVGVDKLGNPIPGFDGKLIQPIVGFDPNKLMDTDTSFTPIAAIVNLGTGLQQIKKTDLRHLYATGRLPSGENLVPVTRDVGSGTRNAFNNSIGLDPSYGNGENVGGFNNASKFDLIGPDFLPSDKGGSSRMEATVQNHRLAVGYSGAERGVSGSAPASWLSGGRLELLAIQDDLFGNANSDYVRPTTGNVLDNGLKGQIDPSTGVAYTKDGYRVGGPGTFITIGNPKTVPVNKGGNGTGVNAMVNFEAAAYINNLTASVDAFTGSIAPPAEFSPAELLASQLILVPATDFAANTNNPAQFIANPAWKNATQEWTRNNNILNDPAYAAFGTKTTVGIIPTRTSGFTYSDDSGGTGYKLQDGTTIAAGNPVDVRNRIAGDFNNDGLRNINDAVEMMKAWTARNGGPAWQAGTKASPELLGDFNGDGNFGRAWNGTQFVADKADIRYWADGLAMVSGKLDRKAGFTAVDDAFGGNFFGTVWANGQTYQHGDSRFDVAGPSSLTTRGWAPIGADGVIDENDYNYIAAQFQGINPAGVEWSNTADAVYADLSADVTGDLRIDQADLDAIGGGNVCYPDCDVDGTLSIDDFICFQTLFALGDPSADCDVDGFLTIDDFICFQTLFAIGC